MKNINRNHTYLYLRVFLITLATTSTVLLQSAAHEKEQTARDKLMLLCMQPSTDNPIILPEVESLINQGVPLCTGTSELCAPIDYAAQRGNLPLMILLIKKGAEVNRKVPCTLADIAAMHGQQHVVNFLAKRYNIFPTRNPVQVSGHLRS